MESADIRFEPDEERDDEDASVEDLESDPAYAPEQDELKDIKGG